MAVPGREVKPDANLLFAQGVNDFAHDVAFAAPPGGVLHAVFGELRRPETEAVMVLSGQDEQLDAGRLENGSPLSGVEVARVKTLGIFVALPPLAVGKGVHAKMGEGDEFVVLPGQLLGAGERERIGGDSTGTGEAPNDEPSDFIASHIRATIRLYIERLRSKIQHASGGRFVSLKDSSSRPHIELNAR